MMKVKRWKDDGKGTGDDKEVDDDVKGTDDDITRERMMVSKDTKRDSINCNTSKRLDSL